ncbi:MAG: S1 RNA-binding domain-containing protein [Lachnospiraceae bacterium]|nr:S1 RNA-binding domain-containing protein [Lachnospiraceae bacterium]
MEENTTMDDLKEELEASCETAEAEAPAEDKGVDPVWATLQQYMDDKTVLTVKIGGVVNGGVIAYVEKVRGFIPASRLALEHVEDLNEWLHKKVKVRVITVDPEKKRLVLSAREILRSEARAAEQEKRKAAFEQTRVGDVMDGTVETLKEYGAFVRLENGLSGLVHVSQISDKRIETPDKVLSVGQTVKVKVTAIKDGKLSLSMKALLEKPDAGKQDNERYEMPKAEKISTNLGSLLKDIKL